MLVRWRAAAVGNVSVSSRVDNTLGKDRLAACLALHDHAHNRVAFQNRGDKHAVKHRDDTGFLNERIGNKLETFGVEAVADRLRFGHRRAHRLGAVLEFAADPFAVDGCSVAVPGEALNADLGDIAAETAITFEHGRLDPRARRSQRCGEPAGAGADHQHIGLADHINYARWLKDTAAHRCAVCQLVATCQGALDGASSGLPRM